MITRMLSVICSLGLIAAAPPPVTLNIYNPDHLHTICQTVFVAISKGEIDYLDKITATLEKPEDKRLVKTACGMYVWGSMDTFKVFTTTQKQSNSKMIPKPQDKN